MEFIIVIRVKFTAQLGTHFVIQRKVFRRITKAFAAKGINYAHRKVIVELPEQDKSDITTERAQKLLKARATAELARQEEEQKSQPHRVIPKQIQGLNSLKDLKFNQHGCFG